MSGVFKWGKRGEMQAVGCGQCMQFSENFSNLSHTGVLIAIVRYGIPECYDMPVGNHGLVDIRCADCAKIHGFQPSGNGH